MNGLWGLNSQQELIKIVNSLNDIYNNLDKKGTTNKLNDARKVLENNYKIDGNSTYSEKIRIINNDIEKCMEDLELIINQMKVGM